MDLFSLHISDSVLNSFSVLLQRNLSIDLEDIHINVAAILKL